MKKLVLFLAILSVSFISCEKEELNEDIGETGIENQEIIAGEQKDSTNPGGDQPGPSNDD